ncbi:MAG: CotH kinase family protein [Bacteroidales bacterium]|nr:CotH kinase family protein [Bacteroidales bacterium]
MTESIKSIFEVTNYDEDYRFKSPMYNLPVMLKDPDLGEIAEASGTTPEELFKKWKSDFEDFEAKVYNGTAIDGVDFDLSSLVNYAIVYNLCGNRELSWPKSTFIYKPSIDEPYYFGPVWDFDWAFTYNDGAEGKSPSLPLLQYWSPLKGLPFFEALFQTMAFQDLYTQRWQEFVDQQLPMLWEFIEEYANLILPSAVENGVRWPAEPGRTAGTFDFR